MSFSSWLRNWKRPAPAARRRTQTSPRQRTSFCPRLEALEERWLPSGLPYPTAATFDQLVADINYADTTGGAFTINLQPSTTFAGGLPAVGGARAVDLTIHGNGDAIDGLGLSRLFTVAAGASLTLDHVTLGGGYLWWSSAGAIYNQGTLTISDSTLPGNTAHAGSGGGIFNAGGTVTVINSTLSGNTAEGGNGGGIYNAGGWVTVNNSVVTGNTATYIDGIGGGSGAGIYNSGGTVTVNHSTVFGNSGSGDLTSSSGSGIHNEGGTVTVENFSNITGNRADVGADVYNYGALYLDSTSTIGDLYGNPAISFEPNAPQLQIRDVTVTEGNTGTVAAEFTVTLSATSTETITVAYATVNGTTTAGSDYQAASGTLTFAPGETSKTVTVLVNGDRLPEPNETFVVILSSPTNATIADGQGTGTIIDDEPRISISDVSKKEGKKNQTTQFTFTVTLSAAYDQPVTLSYQTVNGTAKTGDNDYVAKSGTLTFAPGETTKAITIQVKGDSTKEANETFYLDLFGLSSNALFTKSRGLGTILNDD